MYIKVSTLGYGILIILLSVALVYLILCLRNLNSLIKQVSKFWQDNNDNFSKVATSLPKASDNIAELSENLKLVSEVVTETAATAIETKNDIALYLETLKSILTLIKNVWSK